MRDRWRKGSSSVESEHSSGRRMPSSWWGAWRWEWSNLGSTALALTLLLNVVGLLYPQQLDGTIQMTEVLRLVSSYVTPTFLLVVVFVGVAEGTRLNKEDIRTIALAFVVSLCFFISAFAGEAQLKSIAISMFFFIAASVIFVIYRKNETLGNSFLRLMTGLLAVWVTLPVVLILFPGFRNYFISDFENSFHGFANSRIGFGLWSSMFVILLWCSKEKNRWPAAYWGLMMAAVVGIYLSQSRSAVVGLAVACCYMVVTSVSSLKTKVTNIILIVTVVVLVLGSWRLFGRQEPFQFVNSTRSQIFTQYLDRIHSENYLLGRGGQTSITLANGVEMQAHNLFLQWFANWGGIGVLALSAFLSSVWLMLRSKVARMIFLLWLVFSMTQPVQGTANFFAPITLIWFFVIVGIDGDRRSIR